MSITNRVIHLSYLFNFKGHYFANLKMSLRRLFRISPPVSSHCSNALGAPSSIFRCAFVRSKSRKKRLQRRYSPRRRNRKTFRRHSFFCWRSIGHLLFFGNDIDPCRGTRTACLGGFYEGGRMGKGWVSKGELGMLVGALLVECSFYLYFD